MADFMSMDGRVAVVTGGRRGIGLAIVEMLTRRGAEVVMGDRTIDESTKVAEVVAEDCQCRVKAIQVDVSNPRASTHDRGHPERVRHASTSWSTTPG